METLKGNSLGGYIVDMLADQEVLEQFDVLLSSAYHPITKLYDRLFSIGFVPIGDVSTLIYSIGLFVVKFKDHRKNSDIDLSIRKAYTEVLENKIISKYVASKTVQTIDQAAGVK